MREEDDQVLNVNEWHDLLDELECFSVMARREKTKNTFYAILLNDALIMFDADDWDHAMSNDSTRS